MSALVAVAYPDRDTAEQVRQELIQATKEHGGDLIQTSLSAEDEEQLRAQLADLDQAASRTAREMDVLFDQLVK